MVIFIIEKVTKSTKGELTRWLIEPKSGVFIGNISALVRDKLWDYITSRHPKSGILLIYNAKNEQGFNIRSFGDTTRYVEDFDGILLIKHKN